MFSQSLLISLYLFVFPLSRVIAVHTDAINHCSLTKVELDAYIEKENINTQRRRYSSL